MIRKTLTILSLIGLLLSVVLWGVTGRLPLGYIPESRTCKIGFALGAFTFLWPDEPFAEVAEGNRGFVQVPPHRQARATAGIGSLPAHRWYWRWLPRVEEKLGVFVRPGSPNWRQIDDRSGYFLEVPLWIPTLVFGSLFCACRPLTFHRLHKRKKLGLCVKCGYDLRASKDRCPECGETIELLSKTQKETHHCESGESQKQHE